MAYSTQIRTQALQMIQAGSFIRDVTSHLKVSAMTVHRWMKSAHIKPKSHRAEPVLQQQSNLTSLQTSLQGANKTKCLTQAGSRVRETLMDIRVACKYNRCDMCPQRSKFVKCWAKQVRMSDEMRVRNDAHAMSFSSRVACA
jgi:hypothetical protein